MENDLIIYFVLFIYILENKKPIHSENEENKSENNSSILKKQNEVNNDKNSEYSKNISIDYEDLRHNYKFNMIRKLSKSSHMAQRIGNFSKFMSNIRSSENIYKNMDLKNAHSLNKNLSEIHQMIKGKRFKNINNETSSE